MDGQAQAQAETETPTKIDGKNRWIDRLIDSLID
jgi:hypothetical protein